MKQNHEEPWNISLDWPICWAVAQGKKVIGIAGLLDIPMGTAAVQLENILTGH